MRSRRAGRVAIVTGAGQGIGWGIAAAIAEEGGAVALLGRTAQKVVDVAKELTENGNTALAFGCDVAAHDDVSEAIAETLKAFGESTS